MTPTRPSRPPSSPPRKPSPRPRPPARSGFEGVNEFRKALSDQTATFIPRAEFDAAHASLSAQVTAVTDRMAALELRLTSRLDLGQGADAGTAGQRAEQRLNISQVIAALGFLAAVITLILYVTKK